MACPRVFDDRTEIELRRELDPERLGDQERTVFKRVGRAEEDDLNPIAGKRAQRE